MAGQDLFDERGAGSRQPHDEHRKFAIQAEAADPLEEGRRAGRDDAVDKKLVAFRVVLPAALRHSDNCRALARSRCWAASAYSPDRVEDLGQAEVHQQPLCVRQLPFLQQPPLRGEILLRKPAAEERRQFVVREGEAAIVPQGGAEGVLRALKIADLLKNGAQVAMRSAKSGFSSSARR